MNIWDSVQRGLEKASQEAARIAKIQRLRFTIDGLSRQIYTQNNALITKAMELFTAGQLTQSELIPICRDLASFHQQLNQAQNEMKLIQSQGAPPPPPDYKTYIDNTVPVPAPPPPPGVDPLTVSSPETVAMNVPPPPVAGGPRCSVCHTELAPGNAYCSNCGTPVMGLSSYPPTTRGSVTEPPLPENLETIRAIPGDTPSSGNNAPQQSKQDGGQ